MVAEDVPRQTDARIEVFIRRVVGISVRHVDEIGLYERWSDHVIEQVVDFDRIGFPFVAQPEVDRQPVGDLPVVLEIRLDGVVTFRTITVGPAVRRSFKQERVSCKETLIRVLTARGA